MKRLLLVFAIPLVFVAGIFVFGQVPQGPFYPQSGSGSGFSNPMTTQGDLIFENATPAPARLAVGASGTFLSSNGTTVSWASPGYSMTTAGQGLINFPNLPPVAFFVGLASLGAGTGALCGEFQSTYASTKITNAYLGTGTADASNFVGVAIYSEAGNLLSGTTSTGVHPLSGNTVALTLGSAVTLSQGPAFFCVSMNAGSGTVQLVDGNLAGALFGETTKRFFTITGASWTTSTITWPATLGARTASFNALWGLGTP